MNARAAWPDGPTSWPSLVAAVVAVARADVGVKLSATDIWEEVVQRAPEWSVRQPQSIWGLLEFEGWERENGVRQVGDLRRMIEAEGIEFWSEEVDRRFRLVDTRWLSSHADAFRWVVGPWGGGGRCRFCAMTESPMVSALVSVELERRHGHTMHNGVVVLDAAAYALTHARCRAYWLQLLTTIAPYRNVEEAQAADKAAGRKSRFGGDVHASALPLEAPK
ncbi:MAG: hypothetical protein ACREVO_08140 [Steroidobacteraceae bacterium]